MAIWTGYYLAPPKPFYERDELILVEMFENLDTEQLEQLSQVEPAPLFQVALTLDLWEESCYA